MGKHTTVNHPGSAYAEPRWCHKTLWTREQMALALAEFKEAMSAAGYPEDDVFGMVLAAEEAVANGFDHGIRRDPAKSVRFGFCVGPHRILAEVEDDGEGFCPENVANPLDESNLDRPDGRGLLLMRELTSWIRFNDRGNRVTLCKEKAEG